MTIRQLYIDLIKKAIKSAIHLAGLNPGVQSPYISSTNDF